MSEILLSLSGLTKAYPGVVANSDVSFDIERGEIRACCGRCDGVPAFFVV